MVHYPTPKFIKRSALKEATPYRWSDADKAIDAVATHETCLRCGQSVCSLKEACNKEAHRRCKHCAEGNRGQCTLVPKDMNGRLNRIYVLKGRYDAAVAAAQTPRTDGEVVRTGVKLARAQRTFNLELAHHRRVAAHTGTPLGVATQVPTTSPQYLGLVLVEQRRIATALESIVGLLTRKNEIAEAAHQLAVNAATLAAATAGDDDTSSEEGQDGVQA